MIITRQRGAAPLSSIFTMKEKPMFLSEMILKHREVEIVYYQNGRIKYETFAPKDQIGPIFSTFGRLERADAPYILLLNRKANIIQSKYCTSIVNADCLTYEKLEEHAPNDGVKYTTKDNKSDLFNDLLVEFLNWNKNGGFSVDFKCFVRYAEIDELVTKDLLFLAMSSESGDIENANDVLGKYYDNGKVWWFNEKYSYNPREIDTVVVQNPSALIRIQDDSTAEIEISKPVSKPVEKDIKSTIDEFTFQYVMNGALVSKNRLQAFDEDELVEIVKKYPVLFADIVKNCWSQYDSETASDVQRYNKLLSKALEDAKEDDDNIVTSQGNEFNESYEEYYSPTGASRRKKNPFDTIKCFSCQEFVQEDQVQKESVEGKLRVICLDCASGWDVGVAR